MNDENEYFVRVKYSNPKNDCSVTIPKEGVDELLNWFENEKDSESKVIRAGNSIAINRTGILSIVASEFTYEEY